MPFLLDVYFKKVVNLAHVVDTHSSEVRLEDIPVVRDFLDVFPDDLPDLPPK